MRPGAWSESEVATLREWLGREPYARLAARIGRTEASVRTYANRHGYTNRSYWTSEEDAKLRDHYRPGEPGVAGRIAAMLGRSVKSVHHRARALGLSRTNFCWTPEGERTLLRLNAEGETDTAIAAVLGTERHVVSKRRAELSLSSNAHGPVARQRIRAAAHRQCERLGLEALSQLRLAAWAADAIARGWPTEVNGRPINPRMVQILDALHDSGPATRQQLCERIGMPWRGSRKSLMSNGPGGSYTAELIRSGLVVRLGRQVIGKGKGRSVNLYALAPTVERAHVG